jgi:AcrR family transcriptional regulator
LFCRRDHSLDSKAETEVAKPNAAPSARPLTGRGSKPRVNVAERREAFLLAACGVFLERGVGTATMQDVADAAGVPKILIYRIFRSKQALLDAIRDKVIAKIHEVWAEPAYTYGARMRGMALAAREQPEPFLLVFRYSQAGVEGLDWRKAVEDAMSAYTRGAEARADYASRLNVGQFIDMIIRWIEGSDGLDDEARFLWSARIQREFHLATREAFQLGTIDLKYRLPGDAKTDDN